MEDQPKRCRQTFVAPRSGAWIEISKNSTVMGLQSVAPRSGAWIEIDDFLNSLKEDRVAPRSGAWIEIKYRKPIKTRPASLPVRERGLKSNVKSLNLAVGSRSPFGSVD